MKVLSVRHPWANLIVHGIKGVENRTWKTAYRGRVLIHAPLKREDNIFTKEQAKLAIDIPPGYKSAIIGSVEIIDCITDSNSIWAVLGQWHWILEKPILYSNPVLGVKGKLGLWDYEGKIPINAG